MTSFHFKQLRFSTFLYTILSMRFIGAIGIILAPVTAPHTWRQVDTMATALRYARRWTVETTDFAWWIPAVLNSRNTRGIMAMEFPAIDILAALGFVAAGQNVDLGRILAQGIVVGFVGLLIYAAGQAWQRVNEDERPEGMVSAALLAACCSFASPFTAKFMPDTAAMLLALIGTAGIWRLRWWGAAVLALAILIKPTAGICAALLLLHPLGFRAWLRQSAWVILAILPGGFWYLHVLQSIKQQQELPALFALFEDRNAWAWLWKFWSSADIWDLLNFHVLFQFGWLFLALAVMFTASSARRRTMVILTGIFIIQASLIGAVSGDHARLHAYYLIGTAPTIALLIYNAWNGLPWRTARALLAVGILIHAAEAAVADLGGHWNLNQGSGWFRECSTLREKVKEAPWNQGIPWRTPLEEYPLIDLCLGERGQSPVGEWGAFRIEQPVPSDCHEVATTARLRLVKCDKN